MSPPYERLTNPNPPQDPTHLTGPGIENRPEIAIVKRELQKLGIFLDGFGVTITAVYTKPRPFGFDFDCKQPRSLLHLVRLRAQPGGPLNEDKPDTLEGRVAGGDTHGVGFRQISTGRSLHIEISVTDGKCNAHIDSHGFVTGSGQYDYNRALEHGYWDLAADELPGLFGSFGERGQVGPVIAPMKGVDGKVRIVFGITGHW
jgi:hypothetical protein